MAYKPDPKDPNFWEVLWSSGVQRGQYFDAEYPLPELVEQVKSLSIPKGHTALIPGCGRGYDVELLSRSGLFEKVIGLEISNTAVNTAKHYLSTDVTPKLPQNYDVSLQDFFNFEVSSQQVDFIYDYTFFSAILPEKRVKWAQQMSNLTRKGGTLITVMFPYVQDMPAEISGPPFLVNFDVYKQLLGDAFVPKDGPRLLDDSKSHPGREGRTWWCRWERV